MTTRRQVYFSDAAAATPTAAAVVLYPQPVVLAPLQSSAGRPSKWFTPRTVLYPLSENDSVSRYGHATVYCCQTNMRRSMWQWAVSDGGRVAGCAKLELELIQKRHSIVGNVFSFNAQAICVRCYIRGLGCSMLGSTHMERCSGKQRVTVSHCVKPIVPIPQNKQYSNFNIIVNPAVGHFFSYDPCPVPIRYAISSRDRRISRGFWRHSVCSHGRHLVLQHHLRNVGQCGQLP